MHLGSLEHNFECLIIGSIEYTAQQSYAMIYDAFIGQTNVGPFCGALKPGRRPLKPTNNKMFAPR